MIAFGPVPSRRLGLSLGIDLIPRKTCTFNCVYCQVGRTTRLTVSRERFVSPEEAVTELRSALRRSEPHYITLSGSGEPTLNAEIGEIVKSFKRVSSVPVALLTNGSLFWREEVRDAVSEVDLIMPSLDAGTGETFLKINRPHPSLSFDRLVRGLEELRNSYSGEVWLEVMIVSGLNDSDTELEAIRQKIGRIKPDRIQINTPVRPPAKSWVKPLSPEELESISAFLGGEVIAGRPISPDHHAPSPTEEVLAMIRRRPVTVADIALSQGLSEQEVQRTTKGLTIKGLIRTTTHEGKEFFVPADG